MRGGAGGNLRPYRNRFSNAALALVNGIIGVFLRWDVLHNQADRIDDMTMRITSREGRSGFLRVAASSNYDESCESNSKRVMSVSCCG